MEMKIIKVVGLPCSGKTLVIAHLISTFMSLGIKATAAKFDILSVGNDALYEKKLETPSMKNFCTFICPGFCCMSTLKDVFNWGKLRKVDILFIEISACCCSWLPRINNVPVIIIMDNLRCIYSLLKLRCQLSFADTLVITKTDLVCRAETEMFENKIRSVNPDVPIVQFNGLNGNGSLMLKCIVDEVKEADEI
jgi:Ni2+-binding GTPase involved in maturation of urease and hydrogenase